MSFFKSRTSRASLVLDIASGSIGAGIVNRGAAPKIVYVYKRDFSLDNEPLADDLLEAMILCLRRVLEKVFKEGIKGALDHVVIALSGPWLVSYVSTMTTKENKEFVFDERMVKKILKREEDKFRKDLEHGPNAVSKIFESEVTAVRLNGYAIEELVSKRVQSAEVGVLLSAASKKMIDRIEDEIIKILGVERGMPVHSLAYISYQIIKKRAENLLDAMIIHPSLEFSDIIRIEDNKVSKISALEFGSIAIIRLIAEELAIPYAIARSYLSLFVENCLDQETVSRIDQIITRTEGQWQELWHDVSMNFEGDVFIVSEPEYYPLYKVLLSAAMPGTSMAPFNDSALDILAAYSNSLS